MVSLRAFLKSAMATVAALPFLGFVKPRERREYLTQALPCEMPGLCFEANPKCNPWIMDGAWKLERISEQDGIDNSWGDKFWASPVGYEYPKIVVCFYVESGYVRLDLFHHWKFYRPNKA